MRFFCFRPVTLIVSDYVVVYRLLRSFLVFNLCYGTHSLQVRRVLQSAFPQLVQHKPRLIEHNYPGFLRTLTPNAKVGVDYLSV